VVDAIGPDDRFLNGLTSSVTVEGPIEAETERMHKTLELAQRAPGRYEGHLQLSRYGSFAINAVHKQGERVVARSQAQVSYPYPEEYRAGGPDRALLEQVAALSSGHALASMRDLFDPGDERIEAHEDLWPELVAFALCVFLLDLWLRRVRLFERQTRV
jgi:Ca-activated chloride channel family protein